MVLANPHAGKGRGEDALRTVEVALRGAGVSLEVRRTEAVGHAARLARAATLDGVGVVVAVGGDGTVHEVANGVLSVKDGRELPALGVVPVGTGNDYARMLGVPGRDPEGAARVLLEGEARAVDVGRLEGGDRGPEYFLNNVGFAFMGAANAAHEETRALPGRLSYVIGGFGAFLRWSPDRLTVTVDGVSLAGRFMVVHIGLGRFCGGGVCLTPEALLDDGVLDVCVVAERGKLRGFLQWPRIASGERLEDTAVLKGRRVRVWGPRGMLIHADGEVRRVPTGVVEAALLPGALRVVHDRGATPATCL